MQPENAIYLCREGAGEDRYECSWRALLRKSLVMSLATAVPSPVVGDIG
jgi:hypothetical protein